MGSLAQTFLSNELPLLAGSCRLYSTAVWRLQAQSAGVPLQSSRNLRAVHEPDEVDADDRVEFMPLQRAHS
jgi:hypothetical protein